MVTQRTQGLYRVFLLCQIVLVAVLFFGFLWATLRLWCGYVSCFPHIKQIVLAVK